MLCSPTIPIFLVAADVTTAIALLEHQHTKQATIITTTAYIVNDIHYSTHTIKKGLFGVVAYWAHRFPITFDWYFGGYSLCLLISKLVVYIINLLLRCNIIFNKETMMVSYTMQI